MFRLALLIAIVLPSLAVAQERDPWLGKRVFLKESAEAKVGNETVDLSKMSFPATVGEVNGDLLWLGRAWVQKKDVMDTQQALEFYTQKIRLNPSDPLSWLNRASVWKEKGEVEIAVKDYSEAIRLDPKDATAYSNRGGALKSKGDVDAAIKDYSEAIRLDPNYSVAYIHRGYALQSKGDFDAAIKDYNEAIRLYPRDAMTFNSLAWLYATCPDGKYRDGKKAVEFATKACELSAWKDLNHIKTLAASYAESGDWENAIKYQEKAIEMAASEKDKVGGRERLELFKQKKPYREEVKKK